MSSTLRRTILAAATLGMAFVLGACDKNSLNTLLAPSGTPPVVPGNGAITGKLEFGTGSYPATLVLVAAVKAGAAASQFTSIQAIGSFNQPAWSFASAPHLTQLAPKVWVDTLSLPAGSLEWKFGTNGDWNGNGADYASTDPARPDGLENDLQPDPGGGTNLRATVSASSAGLLLCTLDENPSLAHYRFEKITSASPATFSSTVDGRFTITGLARGTYNVLVRPAGKPPRTIANVIVTTGAADLGTISFGGGGNTGGIYGIVAFDPTTFPDLTSPPFPPAIVQLYQGTFLVTSDTTSRTSPSFSFSALAAGDYRVVVSSYFFVPAAVDPVTVGTAVETLTTVTLAADFGKLASQIHVAGDFNGFTLADSTSMSLTSQLKWEYTPSHAIAAGTYNMKFVTDGSFDNPTDYGGDESVTIAVPVTDQPVGLVSGFGTALHVQFAAAGNYRFTLDERRQTFSIEAAPAPRLSQRRR
ncbi:MAG: carboxypeptidase regulatory-like domain-containing protein [Candidatus Eisenbacteria bacterium]|nr:carboxypeptidase regulatory-like domain-containing protein [Candidatus Eisenbacteria bacterium]